MAPDSNTPDAHRYRLGRLEQDVHDLQVKLEDYAGLKRDVEAVRREMDANNRELSSLRKALYTAALSVTGAAIVFAATLWSAT